MEGEVAEPVCWERGGEETAAVESDGEIERGGGGGVPGVGDAGEAEGGEGVVGGDVGCWGEGG